MVPASSTFRAPDPDRLTIRKPRTERSEAFHRRAACIAIRTYLLTKKLIFLSKFALQVAGQGWFGALSRGDDTYFTMNLQNHRQCPAGGFSFSSSCGDASIACRRRTGLEC